MKDKEIILRVSLKDAYEICDAIIAAADAELNSPVPRKDVADDYVDLKKKIVCQIEAQD